MPQFDLGQFATAQKQFICQAQNLAQVLARRLEGADTVYLREADAGITAQGEDWSLVSLSYDKQKVFSCIGIPDSLNVSTLYQFDDQKHRTMAEVCYLCGLPPREGLEAMREKGLSVAEALHPPALDHELKRLLSLDTARQALQTRHQAGRTLRHVAF
jgi:hypothetical protein